MSLRPLSRMLIMALPFTLAVMAPAVWIAVRAGLSAHANSKR